MKILPTLIYAASALVLCALVVAGPGTASTEKVLYSFPSIADPVGRLDQDSKGALYGTAEDLDGYPGGIFRLKQKNGVWTYKTLFDFSGSDGSHPYAGPLIDRTTGILYGSTLYGGNSAYGNIYSLAPAGRGWSETLLHKFSYSDGAYPYAVLLKDKITDDLYGTTQQGGTYRCGTAFQLAQSNGTWTFSTIYNFSDACYPFTQLKPGAEAGTLIGAAEVAPNGQVFQLKQQGSVWSESILHSFTGGIDGSLPYDLDAAGDGTIYGVTNRGGQYGYGGVFKLTPSLRKKYTFSVIYDFRGGNDGAYGTGINLDAATGNLYGTTYQGGAADKGTVFRLAQNGDTWTETVLHTFRGGRDGANPYSRPIVDRTTGALYGTTTAGGVNDGGIVYMVQP